MNLYFILNIVKKFYFLLTVKFTAYCKFFILFKVIFIRSILFVPLNYTIWIKYFKNEK